MSRPFFISVLALALACLLLPALGWAEDKSGVSPNTISLPSGPGSIEGLGEAFQPTLNTGTAKYALQLQLPPGTAGHAAGLSLSYEGGSGNGPLGFGWRLPTAYVKRQTDKGIPRYIDSDNGLDDDGDGEIDEADEIDVFINEIKEELVPQEDGFYFCENESAFIRYRRVKDEANDYWEGTLPDGTHMEFGFSDEGRIVDAESGRIFCWLLQRMTDTNGNTIVYSYSSFPGGENTNQKYLTKIEYGPGAPDWANLHFVAFVYEDRPDWFEDCRSGFVVRTGKRLKEIVIGTQGPDLSPLGHLEGDFNEDGTTDFLNRKYLLRYEAHEHWSLLTSITPVGTDGVSTLPPSNFGYTTCNIPATLSASNHWIRSVNEPPWVMDNDLVELVDLNGDALPDILKTDRYGGVHKAYLNQGEVEHGGGKAISWSAAQTVSSDDGLAWNVNLDSEERDIAHLADMDGDGLADLAYKWGRGDGAGSAYYFRNLGGEVGWGNRLRMATQDAPPPSPFGRDDVKTADIDFDKRIDIIQSISVGSGAYYQVWFNLGHQKYSRRMRVSQASGFRLSQTGVHIADINGDRVPDILRVIPEYLVVTAGLGHGNFASPVSVNIPDWTLDDRHIKRAKLQDITGDGLADLVIERASPGVLWYWVNLGNYTLSDRKVITGLPNISGDAAIRWADLNGNGTIDLVYASRESEPRILTVDIGELMNCAPVPNLIVFIDNGIGRKTTIEYAPSTRFALADAVAGNPWPDPMPFPVSVVSTVKTEDSLGNLYTTHFTYHDGYYDVEEKEFRGFARVEQIDVGDESAPTLAAQSHFDTGRDIEALKGKLLRLIIAQADDEAFSEDPSSWFSDEVTTWTTRTLMTGTDGKAVVYAFPTFKQTHVLELGQGTPVLLESEFVYDDYGNQTMNRDFGIVVNDDQTAFDDERITETEFALNLDAWLIRSPMRTEIKDDADVVISKTEFFYDDETFSGNNLGVVTKGNLTLQQEWVDPADPGAFVDSIRTKYDAYGNPILLLDPLAGASAVGHYREIVYDERFHSYPERESIHLGDGNESLVIQASYDSGFGTVISSLDFNGNTTTYGYDTFGRFINTVRPGDTLDYPTVEYDYILAEPFGEEGVINYIETRMLDSTGTVGAKLNHYLISRQFIDGLGRELMAKGEAEPDPVTGKPRVAVSKATIFNARQKPASVLQPFYSQLQGETRDELLGFEDINAAGWTGLFHENGKLISLDLSTAHKTSSEYDATSRPLVIIHPDGAEASLVYEPLVEKSFDENDTAPASPHSDTPLVHHRDGLGRLIQTDEIVRLNDDGTLSDALRKWTTRCEYDLNDNLTRITDSLGNVKVMEYDGLKRNTFMDDPDRGRTAYEYDATSNLILQIDNPGEESEQHIIYEYDGANRILSEDYLDEGKTEISLDRSPDVGYYYDVPSTDYPDSHNMRGQLSYVIDLSGAEYLSYDARGNIERKVKRIDSLEGARNFRTAYEYDSLDRVVAITYPDDTRIENLYNERNLLESIPGYLDATDYQPSGQLQKERLANGVVTDYSYDSRLRMSHLRAGGGGNLIQDYRYRFDGASNILEIIDAIGPDDAPGSSDQVFGYDSLYRLIKAQSSAYGTLQYRYNPIGNLIYKSADSGDPRVDLGDFSYGTRINIDGAGPHATTSVSGGAHGDLAITYDANGNYRTYGETVYDFDYLDRLFRVNVPEKEGKPGSISEYRYNYTSQRMVKRVTREGNTEETFYPFPEFEIRNDKAVKYVFAGDRRLARVEESTESEYRRELPAGWNLLALPVEPENPSVHEVLSSLGTAWSVAAIYDAETQRFIISHNGNPDSETFEVHAGTGFWLYLEEPGELHVLGVTPENIAGAVEDEYLPLQLKAGWNLVGGAILGGTSIDQIEQTLGDNFSIWDYVSATGEWNSYRNDAPEFLNTLTGISTDKGYWIHLDTPVDLPASEIKVSRVFFYHPDHLGSSNVITDMNGEIVEKSAFFPYGQVRYRSPDSSFDAAYKFTGKELDVESGLYYYGARYYNPAIGRFVTVDMLYNEYPQSLNLYNYAACSPVNFNDPSGKWLNVAIGAAIGTGAELASQYIEAKISGKEFDPSWGKVALGAGMGAAGVGVGAAIGKLVKGATFAAEIGRMALSAGANVGFGGVGRAIEGKPVLKVDSIIEDALFGAQHSSIGELISKTGAAVAAKSLEVVVKGGKQIIDAQYRESFTISFGEPIISSTPFRSGFDFEGFSSEFELTIGP